ncbi:VUT family protein [Suttonella ornithocola]|uniref:Conserved hypothetical integral membrane protein n=1 Tax=Suttonella ornithocola TaxID=279832 RepID=A0A380MPX4_9GAMM|nr:VUT family protein [Suttonella ornithocola]SUO94372.1 conserved hypothetical integral membrane protein [Suttonella ornithocola]
MFYKPFRLYALILAYIFSVLAANLTLNQFIALPGYGLLSIGTIFFAAIFTLRDRIHATGGLIPVFVAISIAVLVNLAAAIMLETPPRFILASFIAILCGELADTAIYQKFRHRSWAIRVLSSNSVSVPLDTILFTLLAFYGTLSSNEIFQIIYADIIVKYAISLIFIFGRPNTFKAVRI